MSQITTIPQAVSERYHACYNNDTYRAFSLALATALGSESAKIRSAAAWALGRLGGEEARKALTTALASEDEQSVREEIESALTETR